MKSAPGIAFDYRASRSVAGAALVVALAATAAPWFTELPTYARLVCSLIAPIYAARALNAFLTPRFRRIAYGAAGWTLVDADGIEHAPELVASVRLGGWIALDFRHAGRRRFRALIGPDNLDSETRRRLILLLSRGEVAHAI